jgi:ribosome-associated protein
MRREDEDTLDAIRDALDEKGDAARREVAAMHRVEAWRDRLIDDGDDALAAFMEEFPEADRQRLRQLARNALEERKRNKPPRAYREIFQVVRALMVADANDTTDEADDGDALDER